VVRVYVEGSANNRSAKINSPSVKEIKSLALFKGLSENRCRVIARASSCQIFKANDVIITQNNREGDVYFLRRGRVGVLNYAESGRVVSHSVLKTGDYFGELAAIDGRARSATVVANSICDVIIVPPKIFLDNAVSNQKIAKSLLAKFAGIIRHSNERIVDLSLLDAGQRVCLELLHLLQKDPASSKKFIVYPVPTQSSIAHSVGTTRETVARIFGRLASDGIIERKAKTLYIRDKESLERKVLFSH
jgi:CRP/FNR family transcriptional regulator, cyclic AMP receptor protein